MKILKTQSWMILCAVVVPLLAGQAARAQQPNVQARVVEAVDDTRTVPLKGNVHPLARAEFDQGAVADSQPLTRMLLLLQRSSAQELALRQALEDQQTKGSANYHAWLTPEQFGKQYGPADADVQAVTDWLMRQGFQVARVSAGRTVVEFSGNVGQVRNAFHTEIHKYAVKGEEHFANASDPEIPEALAPVVKGVVALHNFPKHSYLQNAGLYRRTKATGELKPLFTFGSGTSLNYAMGPADFAMIYNIPATVNGSPAGTGQSIAIVGQSNINTQDIVDFRSMFGLPAYSSVCTSTLPPQCQLSVIVNGTDPGILAPTAPGTLTDESESDLDVEWSGAIAPNAQILFVTSESTISNPTQVSAGIDLSALYIVDNNVAPVMSESYGECEAQLLAAGNAFYNQLWEQAAAQGITVAIAAGDNGPAGCDPYANDTDPNAANQGLSVSGTASTPYNVAVGGTDFDPVQVQNPATYWNSTSTANTQESAKGYIPEVPWDDSKCALNYPGTPCSVVDSTGADLAAGSGGPSNCVLSVVSGSNINCSTSSTYPNGGYVKPSWQTPPLTPNDSLRDIPDVSFFSSDGFFSGVADVVCESDQNPGGASCNLNSPFADFMGVGGTSAATPAFAAVMALVNQQTGQRQGNANYVLYGLAKNETYASCNSSTFTSPGTKASGTCTFYDITKGNNSVACDAGSPNCSNTGGGSTSFGVMVSAAPAENGNPAFQAVTGYDLATGLGTINVGNLLANWANFSRTVPTVTLGSVSQAGQTITSTATVSPAPAGTPGTEGVLLVALASDKATVLGTIGPFTLSAAGSASIPSTLLPVGTTYVEAIYGGDATLAASTSTPPTPLATAVAGAGYTSKLTVSFVGFNSTTGAPNTPTQSSQSFPYGTPYIVTILVTDNGTSCAFGPPNTRPTTPNAIPCPTGTVTLFANGTPQTDFLNNGSATGATKLNNVGLAEDQPINLSATVNGATPGVYGLTATYSGDSNYSAVGAGGSNTLQITVSKAAPTGVLVASNLSTITSGASVVLTAQVQTNSNGAGPTGMVSFMNGSASLGSANCVPTNGAQNTTNGTAVCTATLTTAISGLYPPPVGEPKGPGLPFIPLVLALLSLLLFALGWRWMPEGRRRAYAYAGLVAFVVLTGVIAGCGGGSGGGGGGGGGSTRMITASYPGDTNYSASSGSVSITVN